ncbi:hypothetical protein SRHO_G00138790 [Serrasalmus rhombeus]
MKKLSVVFFQVRQVCILDGVRVSDPFSLSEPGLAFITIAAGDFVHSSWPAEESAPREGAWPSLASSVQERLLCSLIKERCEASADQQHDGPTPVIRAGHAGRPPAQSPHHALFCSSLSSPTVTETTGLHLTPRAFQISSAQDTLV